ncbi:MAG: VWA domain-containing protein [Phycisphaerae bacterium]|nr:VWA domain-containing protein [Phycisphaerae bacterium]
MAAKLAAAVILAILPFARSAFAGSIFSGGGPVRAPTLPAPQPAISGTVVGIDNDGTLTVKVTSTGQEVVVANVINVSFDGAACTVSDLRPGMRVKIIRNTNGTVAGIEATSPPSIARPPATTRPPAVAVASPESSPPNRVPLGVNPTKAVQPPTSQPVIRAFDQEDVQVLKSLTTWFGTSPIPFEPSKSNDGYPLLISAKDTETFEAVYGGRVTKAIKDNAAGSLIVELVRAYPLAKEEPGLARQILLAMRDLTLKGSPPPDETPRISSLRSKFVQGIDADNPRHLQAVMDWDLYVCQALAGSPGAVRGTPADELAESGLQLARLLLKLGHGDQALKVCGKIEPLCPASKKAEFEKCVLAAKALGVAQQRAAALEAGAAKADTVAAVQLALLWICYGGNPEGGLQYLDGVHFAALQPLRKALGESDQARATFMFAEALYGLSKNEQKGLSLDAETRARLLERARFHYSGVVKAPAGDPQQVMVAKLRLNELGEIGREDAAPDEKKVAFFGVLSTIRMTPTVIYVVDKSGSMLRTFDFVKAELVRSVGELAAKQQFQVIMFADGRPMELEIGGQSKLHDATADNKAAFKEWVKGINPASDSGATDPRQALERAFKLADGSPATIYFLTDGLFPPETLNTLRKLNAGKKMHINTIAFGNDARVAERLMKKIAEENGGVYKWISDDELGKDY